MSIEMDVDIKQCICVKSSSGLGITFQPALFRRLYRPWQSLFLKLFTMMPEMTSLGILTLFRASVRHGLMASEYLA